MELYRAETYKQLQLLNLLDVVIVSKEKLKFLSNIFFLIIQSYSKLKYVSQEGGEGTEFLKRLQESQDNDQQQEVDIFNIII